VGGALLTQHICTW